VQRGAFGLFVPPGTARAVSQREPGGGDREMDRVFAAYMAEYGAVPSGIMRTIAEQSRPLQHPAAGHPDGTRGRGSSSGSGASSDGGADGYADGYEGMAGHKYAGYISPRDDDFVERLVDAEERDRQRGAPQRRSPRTAPPLSPTVAASGSAPPPPGGTPPLHAPAGTTLPHPVALPPAMGDAESDVGGSPPGAMPLPPPTPLPDGDMHVPSRAAFASGFSALAESLGGRPY
jgi:hypothetical protein